MGKGSGPFPTASLHFSRQGMNRLHRKDTGKERQYTCMYNKEKKKKETASTERAPWRASGAGVGIVRHSYNSFFAKRKKHNATHLQDKTDKRSRAMVVMYITSKLIQGYRCSAVVVCLYAHPAQRGLLVEQEDLLVGQDLVLLGFGQHRGRRLSGGCVGARLRF